MDDEEREMLRAEGLDPDDPAVRVPPPMSSCAED
jgi:hypothetical protein